MTLSGFFRNLAQNAQESYRFSRDYWRSHSLSEGYAEVLRETTQSAHDYFRHQDIFTQSVAGASLGVAQLLGGLPIGLVQWSVDVARETLHRGLGAGIVELVRNPVVGMVEGGRSVFRAFGRWASGSLLEQDSFQIAQEVTTVLGTGGLLLMGARDLGRGGRGLAQQLGRIQVRPRSLNFTLPGLIPAFSGAAARPALSVPVLSVRVPPMGPNSLGSGALMMASSRPPSHPEGTTEAPRSPETSPRVVEPQGEIPEALLPLNGRTPEEAAIFASDFQRFRPQVSQVPGESLPPVLRHRILELMERSGADGFEHEFLAIELADGTVLHSDFIHSRNPFRVDNPRAKNRALQHLMDSAYQHMSDGNPPVRVHAYHSHPRRARSTPEGRAFTETNSIDCRAWESYLNVFAQRLSRLGFRGRLEIFGGAVPAAPGLSRSDPYLATFRQSLEVGELP